jgi:DNA polymerase III sliding clamp (beta) subunit (PCNA family)
LTWTNLGDKLPEEIAGICLPYKAVKALAKLTDGLSIRVSGDKTNSRFIGMIGDISLVLDVRLANVKYPNYAGIVDNSTKTGGVIKLDAKTLATRLKALLKLSDRSKAIQLWTYETRLFVNTKDLGRGFDETISIEIGSFSGQCGELPKYAINGQFLLDSIKSEKNSVYLSWQAYDDICEQPLQVIGDGHNTILVPIKQ